jgi:hypothetical protein
MQNAVLAEHSHTHAEDIRAYLMVAELRNYVHMAREEEAVVAVPGIRTLLT